jgi:hypothetical protein
LSAERDSLFREKELASNIFMSELSQKNSEIQAVGSLYISFRFNFLFQKYFSIEFLSYYMKKKTSTPDFLHLME